VLAADNQIEVHPQPDGDQFGERTIHGPGGRLTSAAVPEISLVLDALFST